MLKLPRELRDQIERLKDKYGITMVKSAVEDRSKEEQALEGLEALFGGKQDEDWRSVEMTYYYKTKDKKDKDREDSSPTPIIKDDHEGPDPPSISIANDKRKKLVECEAK
jgi:hypothetical protein